jgi:phage tail-like protein
MGLLGDLQKEIDARSYPPPAFYFRFAVTGMPDTSFQEVSGISSAIEIQEVHEGGESRFVHQLPKGIKQGTLVLKRGILPKKGPLYNWCATVLSGTFSSACPPKEGTTHLLDMDGNPLIAWSFTGLYPVKWEVDPFNSTKNEVAIEKISLRYNTVERTK